MKQLSKEEMKKVVGGNMAPPGSCLTGESTWHCTVGTSYPDNYTCQDTPSSGGCGGVSNCRIYCEKANGSTYWP